MKGKVIASLCSVIGLSVLAAAAFANSIQESSAANKPTASVESLDRVIDSGIVDYLAYPTAETEKSNIQNKSMDWSSEESYLLAKMAMAEAEGEDIEGKALVMLVILNRVWSDSFPDTISEVIYQQGQFSPVTSGRFESVEPNEDCWKALNMIMTDKWDKSMGATYFESEGISTWHRENLKFLFRHGNHYFYKE